MKNMKKILIYHISYSYSLSKLFQYFYPKNPLRLNKKREIFDSLTFFIYSFLFLYVLYKIDIFLIFIYLFIIIYNLINYLNIHFYY